MKSYLTISASILVCFVIFTAAGVVARAETTTAEPVPAEAVTDSVAVTVNGVDITESEVQALIKPQLDRMAAQTSQLPPIFIEQLKKQMRQEALEAMVIGLLVDEQVKASKIVVGEKEVNNHIEAMASQQRLSVEELKVLISARGQSFEQVKQQIRRGLGYQKLMEARWAGKINVTEDDAKKYYSEKPKEFKRPEQVRASHILIKPDTAAAGTDSEEAKAKAKAKAQHLLKQIKEGADFAALAKANSGCPSAPKGGDLGFFPKGQMAKPFEEAAFKLKVGQVSDIVETQYGYHIIKVTDRRGARVETFEQARDRIIRKLIQKKQAKLADEYIELLKAKAKIVYPPGKEPRRPGSPTRKAPASSKAVAEQQDETAVK